MLSLPSPPRMLSFPAPPRIKSLPVLPLIVSFPSDLSDFDEVVGGSSFDEEVYTLGEYVTREQYAVFESFNVQLEFIH